MVTILGNQNSVFNKFIAELRDKVIQKDSMRFRRNLERMGEVLGYELSKTLTYKAESVATPLGEAEIQLPQDQLVLSTILRAGLPVHNGLLNYFDRAENAFVSAYRRHHKDNSFDIHIEYLSCPDITGKTLIISDPMLATGKSMVLAYQALLSRGIPAEIHVVAVISSRVGLDYVKANMPPNTKIWLGAVDEELTAHAYIVPGLGDAGDLAFGVKM